MEELRFRAFAVRSCSYSPGLRQPRHSHGHANVTIVTGGQLDEATERGAHCGRASSVVLKAAGCEHETRISGRRSTGDGDSVEIRIAITARPRSAI